MCYSARYRFEIALKRAKYWNRPEDIEHYKKQLERYDELFVADGFSHPKLIIYTNTAPYQPQLSTWGLIPPWATSDDYRQFRANTLNAAGETMFEKASYKHSARHKRCIIPAEGYYEYHHYKGKTYPFYISRKNNLSMKFAGLWSEWVNNETGEISNTCSIVTTHANTLMQKIHNNPRLIEARMPVILTDGNEDKWLDEWKGEKDNEKFAQQLLPFPDNELQAHTVKKLKGKNSPGNIKEANEPFYYQELNF